MPDIYYRAAPEYRRAERRRAFWARVRKGLGAVAFAGVLYEIVLQLVK
jgi:hypothetical protein